MSEQSRAVRRSGSSPGPDLPAFTGGLPLWEEPSGFLAALEAAAPPAGPPEPADPADPADRTEAPR